tara:strand:+ start:3407 stop:3829 length:423 start_codon:yes stop_codon:yes gene_type:complete
MTYEPKFDVDFARGKIGEDLVSGLPEMFLSGKVEVKTDSKAIKTGNFYVETWQKSYYSDEWKQSGIYLSEADYWAFVIEQNLAMFMITRKALVELLTENWETYREGSQPICTPETNASKGMLVPISDIVQKMIEKSGMGA